MAARSNILVALSSVALCTLATGPAAASRGAFALDAQSVTVAGGRTLQSATAAAVITGPRGDASIAGSLLHDTIDGDGFALSLGGAAALAPAFSLRGGITRVERSAALDAWTIRLGPELHLGATTLGIAGVGTRRQDGLITRGAALDLEHPLSPRVAGRVAASFARADGTPDAASAALGARWNATGPLHLTGEVGLARDPQQNGETLLPGGVAPGDTPDLGARMTARLGARLVFL